MGVVDGSIHWNGQDNFQDFVQFHADRLGMTREEYIAVHGYPHKTESVQIEEDSKKPGPDTYHRGLDDDEVEDKEDQIKKQAKMDDDDPDAYKEMPGDEEARENGEVKTSDATKAYNKLYKEHKYVKSLDNFNEAKKWSSYEQRMVNQIKAAQKEKRGMYTLPMKTQDFYRKHKDMFESVNEGVILLYINEGISVFDERPFGKKGIIIMIDDNGKKVSAIFKDKKNADKFNRNNASDIKKLLQLAKKTKYPKAIDESVINEWGSSDQSTFNKSIHKDIGSPKKMPSPFDDKLRAAAEDAVDFYWDDWEEYQTDRDGLIDDAVRGYLRRYFKQDFQMMQRMFASKNNESVVNEAKSSKEKFEEESNFYQEMINDPKKSVYDIVDFAQFSTGGMTEKQWEMFMYGRYKKHLKDTDTKTKEKMYNVLTKWLGESVVAEAKAYKLKASEFGGDTHSAPYNVKGEPTWRVHSTYAIDQVSGNNNPEERDVVFFEAMPINNDIYIKIGGINNLKRTNGSTYGANFGTTIEEWKNDPKGIAKEASDFLTDATHLKWINKKARSEGQTIKWALKDDYSSVIEDLVNKSLGIKESVNEGYHYFEGEMARDLKDKGVRFKKGDKVTLEIQPNNYVIYGPNKKQIVLNKRDFEGAIDQYVIYESVINEDLITEGRVPNFKFGMKKQYDADDINKMYGFWGTLDVHMETEEVEEIWNDVWGILTRGWKFSDAGALYYLNAKAGRWLADKVWNDINSQISQPDAIDMILSDYARPSKWKAWSKEYNTFAQEELAESVINEEDDKDQKSTARGPLDDDKIETALKKKAADTGVPIGIIRAVMRRGLAAWKSGHRPGANQQQWGYARVNAFLTKGEGTWGNADKDLAKEVRDGGHDKKLKKA